MTEGFYPENPGHDHAFDIARNLSPSLWLATAQPPLQVDGETLSFKDFPYIPKILDDEHPDITIAP